MKNFFDPQRIWPNGSYPHFLILLDRYPQYVEYARQHAELLGHFGHLEAVPAQWLHITVQRVHHPAGAQQLEQLAAEARTELADVVPFEVQLGPTWPGVTAITVAPYPEEPMAVLNRKVRAAAGRVEGIELRAEEKRFWPHTSLAYANPRQRQESIDSTDSCFANLPRSLFAAGFTLLSQKGLT
ncbi:2'-5' RNA ligase family protein [Streptomyces sp. MJM8645]|uniref:2'-5' RNA ligase family protein n=1 Tax=Streptomycetaceae TaxID=2062 RepID=UPI0007AFD328|nr:2'-5' RNA ligase family protein [Streptomyces sp. MJM8645]